MSKGPKLVDGVDYYMESGKMVLTAHFLLKRGYCCNSGCRHCPYKKETEVVAPAVQITGLVPPAASPKDPAES